MKLILIVFYQLFFLIVLLKTAWCGFPEGFGISIHSISYRVIDTNHSIPIKNTVIDSRNTEEFDIDFHTSDSLKEINHQSRSSINNAVICGRGGGGFANFMFGLVSCYSISILLNKPLYCIISISIHE